MDSIAEPVEHSRIDIGAEQERVALSTILPGLVVGGYLIWVNYRGVKNSAKFQMIVVATLLACTVVFCGVALLRGELSNLQPLFASTEPGQASLAAIASAIISV